MCTNDNSDAQAPQPLAAKKSIFSNAELGQLIVEAAPSGMIIAGADGKIVLANPQALQWFGYTESELVGQSVDILIPAQHRVRHAKQRAEYTSQPRPRPMAAGRDLFAVCKDGSVFAADISLHPINTSDGLFVLANIIDAAPRHQAEKERELRQSMERLALLGQLAGGVAHEIRTPLCVISNDVYYLKTIAQQLDSDAQECISEIHEAVVKADRIVGELLDFTRAPSSTLTSAELEKIIVAAIHMAALDKDINLNRTGSAADIYVEVDSDQIERILVNLLRNASQAIGGPGNIDIAIKTSGKEISIVVSDNGGGIESKNLDRIFAPLFTTKAKGIGLGLAVSKRYAEQNGGELVLLSSSPEGTAFQLTLPLAQQAGEHG